MRLRPRSTIRSTSALVLAAGLAVGLVAGCGGGAGDDGDPKTLVVATHDSWAMSKKVLAKFTAESGITVKVQPQGDAGQLTNKLVLTKDSPLADGVYGIDNTFASRAVDEGVLSPYASSAAPASAKPFQLAGAGAEQLTPVDYGDVCVNVDDTWFREVGPGRAEDARRPHRAGVQGPDGHPRRDHVLARTRLPARDDRGQG